MLQFKNLTKFYKQMLTFLIDGKEIKCSGEGNGPVNAL